MFTYMDTGQHKHTMFRHYVAIHRAALNRNRRTQRTTQNLLKCVYIYIYSKKHIVLYRARILWSRRDGAVSGSRNIYTHTKRPSSVSRCVAKHKRNTHTHTSTFRICSNYIYQTIRIRNIKSIALYAFYSRHHHIPEIGTLWYICVPSIGTDLSHRSRQGDRHNRLTKNGDNLNCT